MDINSEKDLRIFLPMFFYAFEKIYGPQPREIQITEYEDTVLRGYFFVQSTCEDFNRSLKKVLIYVTGNMDLAQKGFNQIMKSVLMATYIVISHCQGDEYLESRRCRD